ncbi:MAG: hypothetical protein WCS84_01460 [Nocardioides sp.]|jgi:uncharacterized protein GlcG (DUF336 family)
MPIATIYTNLHATVTTAVVAAGGAARMVNKGLRDLDSAAQSFWSGYNAAFLGAKQPETLWYVTSLGQSTAPASVAGLALRRWQLAVVGYCPKWDKQQSTTRDIISETMFQTLAEAVAQAVFNDYTLGAAVMNCEGHTMTFGDRPLPLPDGPDEVLCHCAEITFEAIERVASTP